MSEAQARVKAARMIMWNSASQLKETRPDSRGALNTLQICSHPVTYGHGPQAPSNRPRSAPSTTPFPSMSLAVA